MNSTAHSLNLATGTVSESILQAAGDIIQREVSDAEPNGLNFGEYVTSSGGNLKCKKIVHAVLRTWDGEKGKALQVIVDSKSYYQSRSIATIHPAGTSLITV